MGRKIGGMMTALKETAAFNAREVKRLRQQLLDKMEECEVLRQKLARTERELQELKSQLSK